MNKESVIIRLGRVLYPKSVNLSKWQVDEAIQIPVRKGRVPIPLGLLYRQERANAQQTRFRKRLTALAMLALALCAPLAANAAQSISIAWNPSTDSSTAGYVVYVGNSSTNLTSQLNVGTNTTVTLSGLKEGTTNFFAVSAYNSANVVGTLSTPISYIVPGKVVMTPGSGTTQPSISFPTAPGHWYQVQASTDLINWANVLATTTATSNAWYSYTDPQASSFSKRFYRLIMH